MLKLTWQFPVRVPVTAVRGRQLTIGTGDVVEGPPTVRPDMMVYMCMNKEAFAYTELELRDKEKAK